MAAIDRELDCERAIFGSKVRINCSRLVAERSKKIGLGNLSNGD
jgi:hypothetical protein